MIKLSTRSPEQLEKVKKAIEIVSKQSVAQIGTMVWMSDCSYLEFSSFNGRFHLSGIYVDPTERKKGEGRRCMELVINACDQSGCECELSVANFGKNPGLKVSELKAWYRSFGFVPPKHGSLWIRQPDHSKELKIQEEFTDQNINVLT